MGARVQALGEAQRGLFGAVTARGEAQVLRLSLIYALMDEAPDIDVPHLNAALEVWRRCEDSARYIFGSALGDRVADEIMRALRATGAAGMTRTEISDIFKRNEKAARISLALAELRRAGLAAHRLRASEGGRPAEVWVASEYEKKRIQRKSGDAREG